MSSMTWMEPTGWYVGWLVKPFYLSQLVHIIQNIVWVRTVFLHEKYQCVNCSL